MGITGYFILTLLALLAISALTNYFFYNNRKKLKQELEEMEEAYEKEISAMDYKMVALQKHNTILEEYAESNKKISTDAASFIKDVIYSEDITDAEKDAEISALISVRLNND